MKYDYLQQKPETAIANSPPVRVLLALAFCTAILNNCYLGKREESNESERERSRQNNIGDVETIQKIIGVIF